MNPLRSLLFCCSMVAIGVSTGCSGAQATSDSEVITVEGRVTVRGNEPFTAAVLETESGNWYVLDLTTDQRRDLVNPSVQRVTGTVWAGEWNSRPFAHLKVMSLQRINR